MGRLFGSGDRYSFIFIRHFVTVYDLGNFLKYKFVKMRWNMVTLIYICTTLSIYVFAYLLQLMLSLLVLSSVVRPLWFTVYYK